jgi:anti-sigma-K factor RskA
MEDELTHELCAGYALDALDPEDERLFEAHLATCPHCRDELAGFARTATALAHAAPAAAPPPALRDRILSSAREDRGNGNVVAFPSRTAYRALIAVAAVASCAAIGLGAWAVTLRHSPNASLQALDLHGASGTLLRSRDGSATLVVSHLVPAPRGKTYEVWILRGENASPAGLFTARRSTSVVRLSKRLPRGAMVGVTLERAGGVDQPTGAPLVTSASA